METFFQILLAGAIAFSVVYGTATVAWRLDLLATPAAKEKRERARHVAQTVNAPDEFARFKPVDSPFPKSNPIGKPDIVSEPSNLGLNPASGEQFQETLKKRE